MKFQNTIVFIIKGKSTDKIFFYHDYAQIINKRTTPCSE